MKAILPAATALVILAACGNPHPQPARNLPSQGADTLRAADSIGILSGDSCCVFGHIIDAAPLPGGGVAVLDRITCRISLFDGNGEFLRSFGRMGEAPGEFQLPVKFAVLPSGSMVVGELLNGRVTLLDPEGNCLSCWSHEGLGGIPLLMLPFDEDSFLSYNFALVMNGMTLQLSFSLRRYDAMTGEVMAEYMSWEGEGRPETDFVPAYISAAANTETGLVYMSRCDSETWRIEVFDAAGTPVDTLEPFPERERLPVNMEEGFVPGTWMVSYAYQDETGSTGMQSTNVPELHPFIGDLGVDAGGNIWARRGGAGQNSWDVLSPEGLWLREVVIEAFTPESIPKVIMGPGGFIAFELNPEDVCRVLLLRGQNRQ